jgi:hypothetical protein
MVRDTPPRECDIAEVSLGRACRLAEADDQQAGAECALHRLPPAELGSQSERRDELRQTQPRIAGRFGCRIKMRKTHDEDSVDRDASGRAVLVKTEAQGT